MKKNRQRLGELGSTYHIFGRGLDRKPLFHDDRDRRTFLLIVRDVFREMGALCFAFSLMPNHYHLEAQTLERPVSDVMHRVNLRYALHHNRRHGGVGHVFQGRFQSVLIEGPGHRLTCLAYVHLNPVAAGLVRGEPELRDYEWTGHAAQMGRRPSGLVEVERVLDWFADSRAEARRKLAALLSGTHAERTADDGDVLTWYEQLPDFMPIDPQEAEDLGLRGVHGVLGDSKRVRAAIEQRIERAARRQDLSDDGRAIEGVLTAVCRHFNVRRDALIRGSRRAHHARARALFLFLAVDELGFSNLEASRLVGVNAGTATRARRRGEALLNEIGTASAVLNLGS